MCVNHAVVRCVYLVVQNSTKDNALVYCFISCRLIFLDQGDSSIYKDIIAGDVNSTWFYSSPGADQHA